MKPSWGPKIVAEVRMLSVTSFEDTVHHAAEV